MNLVTRWKSLAQRRKPCLKVFNPRWGTTIIPLGRNDGEVLYRFLKDHVHSLHFQGSIDEFKKILACPETQLKIKRWRVIQKHSAEGKQQLQIHLTGKDMEEIRRVIKIDSL